MQTTAIFDSAAPFAAGSVQVLVISVDAQLATSAASVTIPSATIPTRTLSFALASMMFILRFAADSVAARVGRAPAGTTHVMWTGLRLRLTRPGECGAG